MGQEQYRTAAKPGEAVFIERKSRFIGRITPVQTEEEALDFLNQIRTGERDANHHVYAYILREGNKTRHSDDGEPQGTAGIPVLEVLAKNGVTNVVAVVTRYFGGVLLGAGGLVRAYSHSAALALEAAGIARMALCKQGEFWVDYALYGAVSALIPASGGELEDVEFGERVRLQFHLLPEFVPKLEQALADATSGRARVDWTGERFLRIAN